MKFAVLLSFFAIFIPATAHADASSEVQRNLDFVWTMIAAGLVFFMQVGFLLLEAGQVRSKNAVNVAQKNLVDFAVSSLLFGAFGFAFMFGPSFGGVIGWSWDLALWNLQEPWVLTFFVFQMVFCGTAATIVSGAVAERMSMAGYLAVTALLATIVYPIAGHWSWGGLLTGDETPFLASWGFMDFAGSTVVHSVGAWAGLAAALLIGPRFGKFDENGRPRELHGHSPVLASAGALVIWVGWIGFNGGSTTAGTPAFALIVANTMAAGVAGAVVQSLMGRYFHGYSRPEFLINGALAGLVGITAGCDAVSLQSAVIMGALASAVCYGARQTLERKGLDDPLGAVAVHGFAGVTGTVLVAVFAPTDALLASDRLMQIGVQLAGVSIYFVWTFGIVFAGLWMLMKALPSEHNSPGGGLRVPPEAERIGLNAYEHNAPLGMASLVDGMTAIVQNPDQPIAAIPAEPGEESYEAALLFNRIRETLEAKAKAEAARALEIRTTLDELDMAIKRAAHGDLAARVHSGKGTEFEDLAGAFNTMLGKLEEILGQIGQTTQVLADVSGRMTDQSRKMEVVAQGQVDDVEALSTMLLDLQTNLSANGERVETALSKVEEGKSSGDIVRKSSATMVERIEYATTGVKGISASIDRIDDIALETRLLSLNASVEAARAGDGASAGFAVVAQEVRKLADSSAETSNSVRIAIEDVIHRAEGARSEVAGTDAALDQMLKLSNQLASTISDLGAQSAVTIQVTEKVAQSIQQLKAKSVEVLSEAAETEALAGSLQEQSKKTERLMETFNNSSQASPKAA